MFNALPRMLIFAGVTSLCVSCINTEPERSKDTLPEELPTQATAAEPVRTSSVTEANQGWFSTKYSLEEVADVDQPTALSSAREGSIFVTERAGKVRLLRHSRIRHRKPVIDDELTYEETDYFQLQTTPVLDISHLVSIRGEGGLLGIEFSAGGDTMYLNYTDVNGDTVVASYAMEGDRVDSQSRQLVIRVPQPASNHNGGHIAFGPDGFLYIGLGDGGRSGDPSNHGQNTQTLLGSILRIDPGKGGGEGQAYAIPVSNPFRDKTSAGREEIWLWGVRNPWRFSFDADTGDLWIGDVGQHSQEEIDYLPNGRSNAGRAANLGWNRMEGFGTHSGDEPKDHVKPLYTYITGRNSCSVIGGYVYRGSLIEIDDARPLEGVYLFADLCSPGIRGLVRQPNNEVSVEQLRLNRNPESVLSFGEVNGEIFVLEQAGTVSRLSVPNNVRRTSVVASDRQIPRPKDVNGVTLQPGDDSQS